MNKLQYYKNFIATRREIVNMLEEITDLENKQFDLLRHKGSLCGEESAEVETHSRDLNREVDLLRQRIILSLRYGTAL